MDTRTRNKKLMCLIVGVLFTVASIIGLIKVNTDKHRLARCTEQTRGQVIRVTVREHHPRKSKNYNTYMTEYSFEANGTVYTGVVSLSEKKRLDTGDSLYLHYDPDDPENNNADLAYRPGTPAIVYVSICLVVGIVLIILPLIRKPR